MEYTANSWNLLIEVRHMIWVVIVPGAGTSPGHQEPSDETHNQGTDNRCGYCHGELLCRVV